MRMVSLLEMILYFFGGYNKGNDEALNDLWMLDFSQLSIKKEEGIVSGSIWSEIEADGEVY